MIVTAFVSDRGDKYLPDCIASYRKHVTPQGFETVIDDREHVLGMAGAADAAWQWALDHDADYLFHVEEDFIFTTNVNLGNLARILDRNPHLAQVALKRQPWSPEEKTVGGFMEQDPAAYEELFTTSGQTWCEHRKLFTLNPCLIPRRVLERGWKESALGVERAITDACLNAGESFAYYGALADGHRCEHVGLDRGGIGWHW